MRPLVVDAHGFLPAALYHRDCIEHVQLSGAMLKLPGHLQQRPLVGRRRRQLARRCIRNAAGACDAGQLGDTGIACPAQRVRTHPHIRTQMAVLQSAGALDQGRIAGFAAEGRAAAGWSTHFFFVPPTLAPPALPALAPRVGVWREVGGFVQELGSRLMPNATAASCDLPKFPLPTPRSASLTAWRSKPFCRANSTTVMPLSRRC